MTRITFAIGFLLLYGTVGFAEDLVLVNGTVIDGTGKQRSLANIRIREGKISDVGIFKPMPNETTLDVKGMVIAPGFVEFQNQSPAAIENDSSGAAFMSKGITTVVLGSDGTGPYSVEEFM